MGILPKMYLQSGDANSWLSRNWNFAKFFLELKYCGNKEVADTGLGLASFNLTSSIYKFWA